MPWKEPGRGDKDPWKSGGQQPPDLEEIFRNMSSRLQSIFGGGSSKGNGAQGRSGGVGGALTLVLLLIIVWAAWDSVHMSDEAE